MRAHIATAAALLAAGLLAAACGEPTVPDGAVECSETGLCPPGLTCGSDGRCYHDDTPIDASVADGPDDDSSVECGNDRLDEGETCDPPSSCPQSCADGNACTTDIMTGSPSTCDVVCSKIAIEGCIDDDGCCPAACSNANDNDCSATCGNGDLEAGETCDPPGTCPTECDDDNDCTEDTLFGSPSNCNVSCSFDPITSCSGGDGCCPFGCSSLDDNDCSATCGNGDLEGNETCDPPSSCPTTCEDGDACTINTLIGSASTCSAECVEQDIVSCIHDDGCCPPGCIAADNDCDTCGDGFCVPAEGETAASCPDDCICGDFICDPSESPSDCPEDCLMDGGVGDAIFGCDFDDICEPGQGEDELNCPSDCGVMDAGAPGGCDFDGICEPGQGEDELNCPSDCLATKDAGA